MLLRSHVSVWVFCLFVFQFVLSCLMFPRMCWPTVFSRTYSSAWLQKYRVLFHSDLRSTTPVQPTTPVEFPDSNNHNIHYTIQSFLIYRHTHHRTSLHFLSFYTTSPYPPPQLQPPHPPPPTQENLQLRHYPSTRNWIMSNSVSWHLSVCQPITRAFHKRTCCSLCQQIDKVQRSGGSTISKRASNLSSSVIGTCSLY